MPYPEPAQTDALNQRISKLPSPLRLFALIAASAFSIEICVMFAFEAWHPMSRLAENILDAVLLTLLLSPVLYLLMFRPLQT